MEGAAAGEFGFLQLHPKGRQKEAGVGGSLRPAVWDKLTSPIPPTRQNNNSVPHLDLHGFLRPEHLVGGSGAPPPKQAHTVGP